jgi:omega-amidase
MFTTGFSMDAQKIATSENDLGVKWMIEKAIEKDACIVGSIAIKEHNKFYNRLFWVMPDGSIHTYNKRHLFRMANEHNHYTAGDEKLIIEFKGWKFCPFVCYDLRFPVWSRNVHTNDSNDLEPIYDCAIYVANWPAVRSDAWQTLLKARAIENLCYVVGVNRVGMDGNGMEYDGKSSVFDFKGNQLDNHINYSEGISIVTLDLESLVEYRKIFPAYLDADK